MADAMLRQWAMLKLIPKSPRKTEVSRLKAQLADMGYFTDLRTIQRDLNKLSEIFPLVGDGAKPQGWSWLAEGGELGLQNLDPHEALTLKLVQGFIDDLLPVTTHSHLAPYFAHADKVLQQQSSSLPRWPDKIRVLPKGQPLLPPKIDLQVQHAVYQALLEERRLTVHYQPRDHAASKSYEVNPLALVVRNQVVYLVCTLWDYSDIRQLLLHRMISAELLDKPIAVPADFDLDAYIQDGAFGFRLGGLIRLQAEFAPSTEALFRETPLSEDQQIDVLPDQFLRISATVRDTAELQTWLNGFGALCRKVQKQLLAE